MSALDNATPMPRMPRRERAVELLRDPVTGDVVGDDASGDPLVGVASAYAHQLDVSRRLATFGMIASGLSHHVLNPLTAIAANADLMPVMLRGLGGAGGDGVVGELAEMCDEIRSAAQRIHDTIRCMRRLAAAPAATPRPVRVTDPVDDALGQLAAMAPFVLEPRLSIPRELSVMADRESLAEALYQLIRNACEAIQPGHTVWIEAAGHPDDTVTVSVVDDGPGVPAAAEEHIFEPFFST
ncbi:MAG: HAMP domain-containing histidine kinase, partial [Myxococcales bacterium]|nr:HAMP domain-containing histidine kinase [Myxococcales bacterium]